MIRTAFSPERPLSTYFRTPEVTPGPVESSKRLDRSGGPGSRIGALAQRVPAQAQQVVADVVRILAAVVGRLRTPLLVVLLLPVILGVLLVAVSAIRGGADLPIACVLALLAVVPSGWLAIRRRQLLVALQPPEPAGAEIYAIFSAPQVLATVKSNLIEVAARSSGLGFRSLGRSVWKGRLAAAGAFPSGSAARVGHAGRLVRARYRRARRISGAQSSRHGGRARVSGSGGRGQQWYSPPTSSSAMPSSTFSSPA